MSLLSELKNGILKGREIIAFILFTAVVYKGHGMDVYLGMNILLPVLQHSAFHPGEKAV